MDCIVRGVAKNRTRLSNFHFHYTKEDQSNGDVDSRSIYFFSQDGRYFTILHFDEHDQVKKQRLVMQNLGENCRKEVYLSSIGQGGWDPEQRLLVLEGSTDSSSIPSLYSDLCSDISGMSFLNILPKIVPCLWITALLSFVIPFLSSIMLNIHIFIKLLFVFYPGI